MNSARSCEAVTHYARENMLNGPAAYGRWLATEQRLRERAARLLGAAPDDMALLGNTTEGINLIAAGLPWRAGDNVVLPAGEFASNRLPWLAQSARGVEAREIDIRAAADAEQALVASATVRPLGSKQENSKYFWYSRSTALLPPRFFSTVSTTQSRKRCAWYGLNSMLTLATPFLMPSWISSTGTQ